MNGQEPKRPLGLLLTRETTNLLSNANPLDIDIRYGAQNSAIVRFTWMFPTVPSLWKGVAVAMT